MAKITNDQFRELNAPVQLYLNKVNHWVIVLRRADIAERLESDGESAVLDLADQAINDWWRQVVGPQNTNDMRATGVMPAEGLPSGQRLQHVQPWPITFDDSYVYVSFEFEPKGKTELAWPWQVGVFSSWDKPISGLIATYKPHQVIEVPDTLDTLDTTWEDVKDDASKVGSGLKNAVVFIGVIGLLLWAKTKSDG